MTGSAVRRALRPFGTSIFTEMTALSNAHGAVNLSHSCTGLKERRGGRDLVRFCFCKRDETLAEALRRLRRWRGR